MVSIAAGTLNSRPMIYNASSPVSGVSISDGAVSNAAILDFKDPKYREQYNRACRDLADLKRVEKGLNNPEVMDHNVRSKVDEVSDFYAGNTFAKMQKVGLATFVASPLPFIPRRVTGSADAPNVTCEQRPAPVIMSPTPLTFIDFWYSLLTFIVHLINPKPACVSPPIIPNISLWVAGKPGLTGSGTRLFSAT